MTLRIERFFERHQTRIRLSGELRFEQIADVRSEIKSAVQQVVLDLDELELVDINAVRFLNACEAQDIRIINCAPYVREWMFQERANERNLERS